MKFTVFGASGFIGGHLARHLVARGFEVFAPGRAESIPRGTKLGHAIYAIGLTGDFRQRPFDTIEAHVGALAKLIRNAEFDSWLYLSSTRVYGGLPADEICDENRPLGIAPSADSLYDLSKLLGEALCLGHANPAARVARLSNVFGPGQSEHTFLGAVLAETGRTGRVTIRENQESSKDYVAIDDVVRLLCDIALSGRSRLYNVASGALTTHGEIARCLETLDAGVVTFAPDAPLRRFPPIDISRARDEFGFAPRALAADIGSLIQTQSPHHKDAL